MGGCVREAGLAGKTTLVTFDLSAELRELIRTNVNVEDVIFTICSANMPQF